jgi:hypothetical protein
MPGSTIGLSLPYGFAGNVSHESSPKIENRVVKSNSAAIPFGAPVILNTDNTVSLADATVTADNFGGIAVAEVKQLTTYPNSTGTTNGAYQPGQPCDFVKEGIVNVKAGRGTLTAGGKVYVRTALSTAYPSSLIGDLEGDSDPGKNVVIPSLSWHTGKKDSNGITTLKLKYPNN